MKISFLIKDNRYTCPQDMKGSKLQYVENNILCNNKYILDPTEWWQTLLYCKYLPF